MQGLSSRLRRRKTMIPGAQPFVYCSLHAIPGRYNLGRIAVVHAERFRTQDREPTIYLANHVRQLDALAIFSAFHASTAGTVLRPIVRDDIYLDVKDDLMTRLRRSLVLLAGQAVGAIIITRPDTRIGNRKNSLYVYSRALSAGEHVLLFPQGMRTRDGSVNSVEAHLAEYAFCSQHLDCLASLVRENGRTLHAQLVHHNYEPMSNTTVVTPGKRFDATQRSMGKLSDELAPCTTVTPLNIYAALTLRAGRTQAVRRLPESLDAIIHDGTSIYPLQDPGDAARQVDDYTAEHALDLPFLANAVKHLPFFQKPEAFL